MERYADLLLACPLFAGLSREELLGILPCLGAEAPHVAAEEALFLEGDPAGRIGIVLEGSLQIVRDDFYGNRSLLAVAQPGELFAEVFACAGAAELPVSVYARQESRVLLLDCRRIYSPCEQSCLFHRRLLENLLRVVAQKSLELQRKIRLMSEKTTRQKLMAYLLDQAKRQGSSSFSIPLDRQSLADYLGVERSAMSAELGRLRRDGVLETKGSWFRLCQSHDLQE